MKEIFLTQGCVALINDEDYERINKYKWCATWVRYTRSYRAERTDNSSGTKKTILMHRVIIDAPAGFYVDHINHDTLDNRKQNLRICTPQQNVFNSKKRIDNTSGYTGVNWHKISKKWRAQIRHSGKFIFLGSFSNKEEAHKVYQLKAKELFGEFHYKID